MPFYKSSLNTYQTYYLQSWEDPRKYSDFLIEISEQEYRRIRWAIKPVSVCRNCMAINQLEDIKMGGKACLVCGHKA